MAVLGLGLTALFSTENSTLVLGLMCLASGRWQRRGLPATNQSLNDCASGRSLAVTMHGRLSSRSLQEAMQAQFGTGLGS